MNHKKETKGLVTTLKIYLNAVIQSPGLEYYVFIYPNFKYTC